LVVAAVALVVVAVPRVVVAFVVVVGQHASFSFS